MKWWLLIFAFIGCVAIAQEDDGSEPFDSGVDDWGFEETAPPKPPGDMPPPPGGAPPPPGGSQPENPRDANIGFGGGGFNGGGFGGGGGKAGAVRFHKTGEKKPPVQKKNWPEIKKSLMK